MGGLNHVGQSLNLLVMTLIGILYSVPPRKRTLLILMSCVIFTISLFESVVVFTGISTTLFQSGFSVPVAIALDTFFVLFVTTLYKVCYVVEGVFIGA